ncbi:MAG: ribose-5-phosphate isomerase RpiA [Burkholderiaceae bacterium]|nr:ribose-5-phosphate isomerase RpiA [Burkholderiaceae bacterium]
MTLDAQALKQAAAQAAIDYIEPWLTPDAVIGVGTGSTADLFIDLLCAKRDRFKAAVASSERTAKRLRDGGVAVLELDDVASMPVYVDGADEINAQGEMIKGGGGALTREKIVASVSDRFVCIVDASKQVDVLGRFPLPIEVIPMAQAAIIRRCEALGGQASVRQGFVTDNGNVIVDVSGLSIRNAAELEARINHWPGVVTNGLFALEKADVALVASRGGVTKVEY